MLVTIRPRGSALGSAPHGRQSLAADQIEESCEEANRKVAAGLKAEGNALYLRGDFAPAAFAFSAALRMTPRHSISLYAALLANRSAAYLQWGQPELAAADAQAALIIAPSDVKPYHRLAKALTAMGMHAAAVNVVDRAIRAYAEMTARQQAQLGDLRSAALARVAPGAAAQDDQQLSTRLTVRSPRGGSPLSHTAGGQGLALGSTGSTGTCTIELLTVGDGGVLLQTLSLLLHVPRARLKVICAGALLRQATAAEVVRAAARRMADGRTLALHVMGDSCDDESTVDSRDVEVLRRQLRVSRKEAVTRLRAAQGDVFNALLH
ncbi:hypothetical protein T492DRAFT_1109785 [Pavlovales sp. CCMP2436]|nr:hypothetical protein T492DRAFT_1109785 [Pavlovales sp. CCMP2436]